MASFSGSKSETVGCGLARSSERREDPDESRVLFMSLDISRINWVRCSEVVDPVIAVVDLLMRLGSSNHAVGAPEVR